MTRDAERLAPGLLAAMPHLSDPNFHRTVVFMLRHGDDGAFGLVVNREAPVPLAELFDDQNIPYAGPETRRIMAGGPVEADQHVVVLHGEPPAPPTAEGEEPDEVPVADGIQLVTTRAGLERLSRQGAARFNCYVGYAGWGPGQLEHELAEGAWVALPLDPRFLFDVPADAVWEQAIRRAGIDPASLVPGGEVN